MSDIFSEHEGGPSGSHSRTGGQGGNYTEPGADRQSGVWRRRIVIAIAGTVAAATAALVAPNVIFTNEPYAENLQMIRDHTARNTNHDGSAHRDTEQEFLDDSVGGPFIGTNRTAYLGSPNGNPEQSFPTGGGGQFRTSCEFSHFAYDDPVLHPRQPGKAHLHMFFGNTDINAYSTYDTMIDSGSSTCNGQEINRTGYWAPAMIDGDGDVRIPERVVVYYKGEGMANMMRSCAPACPTSATGAIAYRPHMVNIATKNGLGVPEVPTFDGGQAGEVHYKCSNNFSAFQFADGVDQIPNCDGDYYQITFGAPYPATRTVLEVEIKFWNCFPTTADDRDWTAWDPSGPTRGSWFFSNCTGEGGQGAGAPPLFDKEIFPNLVYYINYVVEPGDDTSDWFLSSDVDASTVTNVSPSFLGTRGSQHHADWWGGWHPETNQLFLDNCVNWSVSGQASGCGFGYLSDGGPNNANPLPGPTLNYRPQYDTVGDGATYKVSLATLFAEICTPLGPAHTYTAGQNPARGAWCTP